MLQTAASDIPKVTGFLTRQTRSNRGTKLQQILAADRYMYQFNNMYIVH